jgi:hypothetical protein
VGAFSDLNRAIKINPKWEDAYFHRGVAYSKHNKKSKAVEDWAEAHRFGNKEIIDGK